MPHPCTPCRIPAHHAASLRTMPHAGGCPRLQQQRGPAGPRDFDTSGWFSVTQYQFLWPSPLIFTHE
eukprot:964309-Pelagomonas_calceolata.AAC.3